MRNEQQMMDLILSCAQNDDRIRAVTMNGSRTNPNAPRDLFQDYDIVYFIHNDDWDSFIEQADTYPDRFGERIIMQLPDRMDETKEHRFAFLMQFADGNRIDLSILPIEQRNRYLQEDTLTVLLLDKDGLFPSLPPASDTIHRAKKPTEKQYHDCCNEFWWVAPYAAKGLWRDELLYAIEHISHYLHQQLIEMLGFEMAVRYQEQISIGKCGKYLKNFLDAQRYQKLLSLSQLSTAADCWAALFHMGEMFRESASYVAEHMGYSYPLEDDRRVTAFLHVIQTLEKDAQTFPPIL